MICLLTSAITSCMCDRRNRAVKHMYVSPLLRMYCCFSCCAWLHFIEDHTYLKMLLLLHHNANLQYVSTWTSLLEGSKSKARVLSMLNALVVVALHCIQNVWFIDYNQASYVFDSTWSPELSSADLMRHMHKRWGSDTAQPGSQCRSRSAEHVSSVNTPERPQTSCTPHEYRALSCKRGMWVGLLA